MKFKIGKEKIKQYLKLISIITIIALLVMSIIPQSLITKYVKIKDCDVEFNYYKCNVNNLNMHNEFEYNDLTLDSVFELYNSTVGLDYYNNTNSNYNMKCEISKILCIKNGVSKII